MPENIIGLICSARELGEHVSKDRYSLYFTDRSIYCIRQTAEGHAVDELDEHFHSSAILIKDDFAKNSGDKLHPLVMRIPGSKRLHLSHLSWGKLDSGFLTGLLLGGPVLKMVMLDGTQHEFLIKGSDKELAKKMMAMASDHFKS